MPSNKDLGRAIRRLRQAQDRTIEDVALDANIHPTYLSGIERGRRNPTWERISRVARALGVTMLALVQSAEQEGEVARVTRETRARLEAA